MDNAFDRQIKSALEQFEVPYDASTWTALEQRLERQMSQTDVVDQTVRNILQSVEMPYQAAHWDLLTQRMAVETKRRRRVLIMKVLEAAAVFLLLFWAIPGSWTDYERTMENSSQTVSVSKDQKKPAQSQSKRNSIAGESGALLQVAGIQQTVLPATGKENPDLISGLRNNEEGWGISFQVIDNQPNKIETDLPITQDLTRIGSPSITIQEISFLGQKAFLSIPINQPQKTFALIPHKAKRQGPMYVAAMVSFNQNKIKTTAPGVQRTQGYGAGVMVGYQKGRWAVETGLLYNRKTYTPRKEVEIISGDINKGYNGQFVQQVDADLISVPVRTIRQVAHVGRTRAKVMAGVVANVVLDKAYDAKNVFYPGFQTSGPTDPPQFSAAYNGRGVLENGGLDGNAYLSLTGGVRIEHSLNAQTALFAEANYQHAVGGGKGIGPKPARIHTAGLNAGVIQRI